MDARSKRPPSPYPTDALSEPVPAELETLSTDAVEVLDAAGSKDWGAASAAIDTMTAAWNTFRVDVPKRIGAQMSEALDALARAIRTRDPWEARQAALNAARASLDLQLRYRPPVEVNLARFDLWCRQIEADAASGDQVSAVGDVATLEWIRDRLTLEAPDARIVDDDLRFLEASAAIGDAAVGALPTARDEAPCSPAYAVLGSPHDPSDALPGAVGAIIL